MWAFFSLLLLSLAASSLSEGISYYLVYRTERFQMLKQSILRNEERLETERNNTTGNAQKRQRKIESIEAQLESTRKQINGLQMRSTILVGVIQLLVVYNVNSLYDGQSVAKLPFVPASIFKSLAHRGLSDDAADTDCSATFIFVLAGLAFKSIIDKTLQLGVPKGSSLPKWVSDPDEFLKKMQ